MWPGSAEVGFCKSSRQERMQRSIFARWPPSLRDHWIVTTACRLTDRWRACLQRASRGHGSRRLVRSAKHGGRQGRSSRTPDACPACGLGEQGERGRVASCRDDWEGQALKPASAGVATDSSDRLLQRLGCSQKTARTATNDSAPVSSTLWESWCSLSTGTARVMLAVDEQDCPSASWAL